MKNQMFFIVYDECPRFRYEIYRYVWKGNTGEPLKENDDVLCAIRYGIYSDMVVNGNADMAENIRRARDIKGLI